MTKRLKGATQEIEKEQDNDHEEENTSVDVTDNVEENEELQKDESNDWEKG